MYIYTKPNAAPRNVLLGLGQPDEAPPAELPPPPPPNFSVGDRYIQPRVNPATGRVEPYADHPVPWGVADVGLRNIRCRFYHNSPRELVLGGSLPYTMEINAPGHRFIGSCEPRSECPPEVHQGAHIRDPWRGRQCAAWREQWQQEAANIIADDEFRRNLTERVLDVAGITGSRYRVKPAEFIEVLEERGARERPIKLFAFLFLAAGATLLTFTYVRKRVKAKRKAKALEANAYTGNRDDLELPPVRSMKNYRLADAVATGSLPIVTMLLKSKADVNAEAGAALEKAVELEAVEIVRALLEHGADVNAQDNLALVVAAHCGNAELVEMLLDYGANPDVRDGEALRWAKAGGHDDVVELLSAYGSTSIDGFAAIELWEPGITHPVTGVCVGGTPMSQRERNLFRADGRTRKGVGPATLARAYRATR